MNISGIDVGSGQPCRFVFEVSNAHNGSKARAFQLIYAAQQAGADFVKFQCYTPDELVALRGDGPAPEPWGAQGWTMRALYEKAQTPHAWFRALVKHCAELGMPWFSSVFGPESLALLESLGCSAYKIARLDNDADVLIDDVVRRGKPVLVSDDARYVGRWRSPFTWLYCPAGYPPPAEEIDIPNFKNGDENYSGLSSHCLDPRLPIAAVARGAKLLEYHVQLDDEPSELEANVSLTMTQLAQMVRDVRATEALIGDL